MRCHTIAGDPVKRSTHPRNVEIHASHKYTPSRVAAKSVLFHHPVSESSSAKKAVVDADNRDVSGCPLALSNAPPAAAPFPNTAAAGGDDCSTFAGFVVVPGLVADFVAGGFASPLSCPAPAVPPDRSSPVTMACRRLYSCCAVGLSSASSAVQSRYNCTTVSGQSILGLEKEVECCRQPGATCALLSSATCTYNEYTIPQHPTP